MSKFKKILKRNNEILRELGDKENPTKSRRKVWLCVSWGFACREFTIWDDWETRNIILERKLNPFYNLDEVINEIKDYGEKHHLRIMKFDDFIRDMRSKYLHK